ncbi:DUF2239 family protein [Aquidulcibacter sp.]|uniref:DUF2239 family protein n=1 Tax=Aquidulcibacter sp. TaxID=2052990 RepID=UPI0025C20E03|nr:DUF2239 family protein [Aquidulcibacter sp.]MCA3692647.1 DUF2239 family protein [Aquidulcibacter sp.]
MTYQEDLPAIAFAGPQLLAFGALREVAASVKQKLDQDPTLSILVFHRDTSQPIELDLRGSLADVVARLQPAEFASGRKVGRPKLGVAAREVTLLPRHWDWLARQPGGASVTLRKLVEAARRETEGANALNEGREALYRFMAAVAGNEPNYDEVSRALFAGQKVRFLSLIACWPHDVQAHLHHLSHQAFLNEE